MLAPTLLSALGIAGFHAAYASSRAGPAFVFLAMLLFLYCLVRLAKEVSSPRVAFYAGLLVGLGIYAPQLGFFWSIFGPAAVSLWIVLALWIGIFVMLVHRCRCQFGPVMAGSITPFLWTGLEYFRSELYYLRFAWLSPGFAFSGMPEFAWAGKLGVYGIGFVLMSLAVGLALMRMRTAMCLAAVLTFCIGFLNPIWLSSPRPPDPQTTLAVAGVQVEFPAEMEVPGLLDEALRQYPQAQLFMLCEYAFDGPVPPAARQWCKEHRRYLVAGGKDALGSAEFYDTAFVVGPSGQVVFQQAKSVPIQFFKDGLPAKARRPWDSPWGKLGICICYDLSYSRVTDDLARQGIQALLVPTMDVLDWGRHQHELHARVAPMRAAEYGIPIFRVASSGVSQAVTATGRVTSSIPFGQQEKSFGGELDLSHKARLPLDRYLAPFSTGLSALLAAWLGLHSLVSKKRAARCG